MLFSIKIHLLSVLIILCFTLSSGTLKDFWSNVIISSLDNPLSFNSLYLCVNGFCGIKRHEAKSLLLFPLDWLDRWTFTSIALSAGIPIIRYICFLEWSIRIKPLLFENNLARPIVNPNDCAIVRTSTSPLLYFVDLRR